MTLADQQAVYSRAEHVARESYARLLAHLGGRTGDLALAEDALAEAFLAALEKWCVSGIPDNPDAWLLAVARRRKLDGWRKQKVRSRSAGHMALIADELMADAQSVDTIPDSRLALLFACVHPQIEPAARTPLMLQTILGLTAHEIAARYLVSPATMGQRLVRAKAKIKEQKIPFAVPDRQQMQSRLSPVLSAIYAAYTSDWMGNESATMASLSTEAIWLARVAASQLPGEPEPKALLALLLYSEARRASRTDCEGRFVPLEMQDTYAWDRIMLDEADNLLREANSLGNTGRYQIEAAIQSAHVVRRLAGISNWKTVIALYDALEQIVPSPVVRLNRAAARAAMGEQGAALKEIEALSSNSAMADYLPYWATRAQLLVALSRGVEADQAFSIAIGLCENPIHRQHLEVQRARFAH